MFPVGKKLSLSPQVGRTVPTCVKFNLKSNQLEKATHITIRALFLYLCEEGWEYYTQVILLIHHTYVEYGRKGTITIIYPKSFCATFQAVVNQVSCEHVKRIKLYLNLMFCILIFCRRLIPFCILWRRKRRLCNRGLGLGGGSRFTQVDRGAYFHMQGRGRPVGRK